MVLRRRGSRVAATRCRSTRGVSARRGSSSTHPTWSARAIRSTVSPAAIPISPSSRRRHAGLRVARSLSVNPLVVATVIAQRVTGIQAARSWASIVRRFGERAPGPGGLVLPPSPQRLAALPYYRLHPSGIEQGARRHDPPGVDRGRRARAGSRRAHGARHPAAHHPRDRAVDQRPRLRERGRRPRRGARWRPPPARDHLLLADRRCEWRRRAHARAARARTRATAAVWRASSSWAAPPRPATPPANASSPSPTSDPAAGGSGDVAAEPGGAAHRHHEHARHDERRAARCASGARASPSRSRPGTRSARTARAS